MLAWQPPATARSGGTTGTHGAEDAEQLLDGKNFQVPMLSGRLLKRFLQQAWAAAQWALRAELEERPTKAMQAAALFHEAETKVRSPFQCNANRGTRTPATCAKPNLAATKQPRR